MNLMSMLKILGSAIVYALLSKFAAYFLVTFGIGNCFYLANGFMLAILLVGGYRYIIGLLIGAFFAVKSSGLTNTSCLIYLLSLTLGLLVSYWLIIRSRKSVLNLGVWPDYVYLIANAALGSLLTALIINGIYVQTSSSAPFYLQLLNWWLGDFLGVVAVSTLILTWWPFWSLSKHSELSVESLWAFASTFVTGLLIYNHWLPSILAPTIAAGWLLPFFAWAALRAGAKEMALITLIGVVQALMSLRQFYPAGGQQMVDIQQISYVLFLGFLSLFAMSLMFFIEELRREKAAAFELQEFYRMIAERTDDLIAVLDLKGTRIYNTLSYRRLFGNIERFQGSNCFNEIHVDDQDRIKRVFNDTVRFGIGQWTEFRFVLTDGSIRNMESRGELLRNSQGKAEWVIVVSRDITDRKRIEESYRIANIAFESQDGMFITDVNNIILKVNHAFTNITGFSPVDVVGKTPFFLNADTKQADGFDKVVKESINRSDSWRGEVWSQRKNGEEYLEQVTISVVRDDKGVITHYLTLLEDITARKSEEEKIKQLAFHDPLTQLANRRKLLDRLKHSIQIGEREGRKMALLMVDIDRFKAINDIFGNSAGDQLLQLVAGKLKARIRDLDLIARFGSDEFIVFLENADSMEHVSMIAENIISDLSQPFNLTRSKDVRIGVNIGISLYPEHADSAEMLLEQADVALYQAKDRGRGGYVYFSENFIRTL